MFFVPAVINYKQESVMKKKLMAVAVAGVLGAPALVQAQTSTVQIYGALRIDYLVRTTQGDGLQDPDVFSRYGSAIGFRGEEKLGRGMSAWFQCESTLDAVEGGAPLCTRNSAIGFKSGMGNIFVGNWDTPHKRAGFYGVSPFSVAGPYGIGGVLWNSTGSNAGNGAISAGEIGGASTAAAAASFLRRQSNSINYHSPRWGGFQAMAAFTTTDEATAQAAGAVAAKPRLWSLGADYRAGPIKVGAGYENHKNYNPGVEAGYTGGNDTNWHVNAAYTFAGRFTIGGIFTKTEYEMAAGTSLEHKAWGVYGEWQIAGPHELRVGYTQADDTEGTAAVNVNNFAAPVVGGAAAGESGGKLWALQYAYAFSKRTEVNVGYVRQENDARGRYRLETSLARNPGQDQAAVVVGVIHRF